MNARQRFARKYLQTKVAAPAPVDVAAALQDAAAMITEMAAYSESMRAIGRGGSFSTKDGLTPEHLVRILGQAAAQVAK